MADNETPETEVKKNTDPNVGGGVDRDKLDDGDFVDSEHRRFPVVTPADVSDAVASFGRMGEPKMEFDEFKRKLTALCERKGAEFVAALPKEWKDEGKSADTLVCFGGAVKALGDGKLGGYLVEFHTADDPDLDGEFFDAKTDFDLDEDGRGKATVYYQHGFDPVLGMRKLAKTDLTLMDAGVWAETQLKLRDEYERFLNEMAQQGKLGWSSGTASHLVLREPQGKAVRIKRWPLGVDASLTPTPAEPRSRVIPLKSFPVVSLPLPDASEVAASQAATEQPTAVADTAQANSSSGQVTEVKTMDDKPVTMTKEELAALVGEAVKSGVTEAMKALPAHPEPTAAPADTTMKDLEAEKPFKTFAEQLTAVHFAALQPALTDKRLTYLNEQAVKIAKATGMSEAVPSEGGFLVQPDFSARWLQRVYETGAIASRVMRTPVTGNSLEVNGVDETSRANGSRAGGIVSYWVGEGGTGTPSKPKFRKIELKLKKQFALYYATDEQLADIPALASRVDRMMVDEIRFRTEDGYVSGTGVGMPLGILNSGALVSVAKETGQAAATLVYNNVLKMWSRMWGPSRSNAIWMYAQDVEPQLYTMTVPVGTGGSPVFLPAGGASVTPYATLFGRPMIPVEYCAALGTVGDILLVDWSQYETIDKGDVQTASSIHVQFLTDETAFRFIYRVDGQPSWNATLTPKNASSALSAYVALAARA